MHTRTHTHTHTHTTHTHRNASVAWVLQRHPGLSAAEATAEAQREYEAAAKLWLLAPLEAALRAHPRALVGYYNYPKCAAGMQCEQMPPDTVLIRPDRHFPFSQSCPHSDTSL